MSVHRWLLIPALAMGVASAGFSSSSRVQPVFLSGAPAPAGLTFSSFGQAAMNSHGTVCFFAGWDSLRHRPEGLFLERDGQVEPIVRAGDPVPGHAGERFSFPVDTPNPMNGFALNNHDQAAVVMQQGLYLYDGGALREVARVGDEVPGVQDELWDEIDSVSLNDSGAVAFTGAIRSVQDGDRQEGVFLVTGGNVQIALFDGDTVPDLDGTLNGFLSVALNNAGQMATLALEGDDEIGCLLLTSGTDTRVLAVEGGPAPTGTWTELDSVALNNGGVVAFLARATGAGGEHAGVYLAASGTVTALAQPGQPISGAINGVLGDELESPVLDDGGNVALVGALGGAGHGRALLLAAGGSLTALAVEGQAAPGAVAASGQIHHLAGLCAGSLVAGSVVCAASLQGASVTDGLVRYAAAGATAPLVTTAEPLPAGGVLTLEDDEASPGEVQARRNERGDVVFTADVGGYGRALFRSGAAGPELLTPLSGNLRSISAFDLNDAGQIAYLAAQDDAGSDSAVFVTSVQSPATVTPVAATGDPTPGAASETIGYLGPPRLDSSGRVIFTAQAQAAGMAASGTYLLRAAAGHTDVLAAEGEAVAGVGILAAAPDAAPGTVSTLFRELQVSRDGQIVFLSSFGSSPGSPVVASGLFMLAGGALRAAALPGQPSSLPGSPYYSSLSTPRLSDGGAITVAATVVGPARKIRSGLLRLDTHGSALLAAAGDPAPGLDATHFQAFADPVVDPAGDLAFFSLLDRPAAGGGDGAIFVAAGSSLRLALADGDPVDATAGGVVTMDDADPAAPLSLQADGTLLVAARVRGSTASDGLFLVQP